MAAAMGYYGKVLAITNREAEAVKILREAVDLWTHYAGGSSPVALQNLLFLGESQSDSGDRVAARATFATVYETALRQYGPTHLLTLRAQHGLPAVNDLEFNF